MNIFMSAFWLLFRLWQPGHAVACSSAIIDHNQTSAEGNYTVAWPLAVPAKQLNCPDLADKSIAELRWRCNRLVDEQGAIWLQHYTGGTLQRTYKRWLRGVAWNIPGLAKSPDVRPDLIAKFQRRAQDPLSFQTEEGLWRVFANDTQTAPKTLGTAGIGVALANGVRRDWMGEREAQASRKAASGLYGRPTPDGFLPAEARSNIKESGEAFERETKGTNLPFSLGMMAQLVAEPRSAQPNPALIEQITKTKGLVALWDFKEPSGQSRQAVGTADFPLAETGGPVPRYSEGPLSGYSAGFGQGAYLSLPNARTGALNIHGPKQGVTVVAWVNWTGERTGFVGGMWNEYQGGGKRQYGLFVSLPYYNGKDQVCGHISKTGKPTPPFPYSIDYSASKQPVPPNEWVCVAFTYDGNMIKSYVNGVFEARPAELIDHTRGMTGYPDGLTQSKNPYFFPDGIGNNGSDFTVGAVLLKSGMGNLFTGKLGGLAVFDRALSATELTRLVR